MVSPMAALVPVVALFLCRASQYLFWEGDGTPHVVTVKEGVVQGDPLALVIFALGRRGPLGALEARLRALLPAGEGVGAGGDPAPGPPRAPSSHRVAPAGWSASRTTSSTRRSSAAAAATRPTWTACPSRRASRCSTTEGGWVRMEAPVLYRVFVPLA